MLSKSPDQLPAVLFVDDEPKTCKHFTRLFGPRFRIFTAGDGIEAMKIFQDQSEDIGIIMTDQRMPNETGTEFLEKAARLRPAVKRILSTAYVDVDAAVDAVNNGGIYRYITKPWEVSELEMTLIRAMELYLLETERELLLTKKASEMAQLATRERLLGLAALSVFKDSTLRHVADAIGSLNQLGNTLNPPVALDQWDRIYQSHRQFLELAHSSLPGQLSQAGELDHTQEIPASEVCRELARNNPRLENPSATGTSPSLPGSAGTLASHLNHLIKGFEVLLPNSAEMAIQETTPGITLNLPADSMEQALLPLFSHTPVSDDQLGPCLELVTAVLSWHHQGGQLNYSRLNGTLIAQLGIVPFTETTDPWRHLAADLIGNSSFWVRQI
ncbi:response regulator [Verrucomicrobiaceae bacterium 227]